MASFVAQKKVHKIVNIGLYALCGLSFALAFVRFVSIFQFGYIYFPLSFGDIPSVKLLFGTIETYLSDSWHISARAFCLVWTILQLVISCMALMEISSGRIGWLVVYAIQMMIESSAMFFLAHVLKEVMKNMRLLEKISIEEVPICVVVFKLFYLYASILGLIAMVTFIGTLIIKSVSDEPDEVDYISI